MKFVEIPAMRIAVSDDLDDTTAKYEAWKIAHSLINSQAKVVVETYRLPHGE